MILVKPSCLCIRPIYLQGLWHYLWIIGSLLLLLLCSAWVLGLGCFRTSASEVNNGKGGTGDFKKGMGKLPPRD